MRFRCRFRFRFSGRGTRGRGTGFVEMVRATVACGLRVSVGVGIKMPLIYTVFVHTPWLIVFVKMPLSPQNPPILILARSEYIEPKEI